MYLLKHKHFPNYTFDAFLSEKHTKSFQRPHLTRLISQFVSLDDMVADIGAHRYFDFLRSSGARSQAIIDPYNGAPGAGLADIPPLPYPIVLFRCMIGVNSEIIPDNLFDLTFSCSVLEHIGQAESGYNCNPENPPPAVQESIRDKFCSELYRITKPGGLTIHTVDHAARNLTFRKNLEDAGFKMIQMPGESLCTVEEALTAPDAVRQRCSWFDGNVPMPSEEVPLHAVVVMVFKRPK